MKIKFYDEFDTLYISQKDENGRSIRYSVFSDVSLVGHDLYYPNVLLKADDVDYLVLPIKEDFMSLKCGTTYEKTMEYDIVDAPLTMCEVKSPVFFFVCNTVNYYHFLYDAVSCLITFFHLKKIVPSLKLLMNYSDPQSVDFFPFVKETLELVGIKMEDIIIHQKENKYKTVYVGSSPTHDKLPNVPPRNEVYDLFRDVANKVEIKNSPKKIYVSRRSWIHGDLSNIGTNYTTKRIMVNEDAVVAMVQRHGFVEVFCENMSMKEKINLFRCAEIVIGSIGGGMCNLLFSTKKTIAKVIISPTFLDINQRFLYAMNTADVECLFISSFADEGIFKKGMRVVLADKSIAEIDSCLGDDLYNVAIRRIGTTGCESRNGTQTRIVRSSHMTPIDNGLNSPWKVDVELLEKYIRIV